MITSKQRAYLRGLIAVQQPIMQIGKNGMTEALVKTLSDALEAHELIKLTVLETCPDTPRAMSDALCEALGCDPVQVIGRKIALYRPATEPDKRRILLPR